MNGRRMWILAAALGLAGCGETASQSRLFNRNPPCDRCGQPGVPPDQRLAPVPFNPAGTPAPPPNYMPPVPTSAPTQLPPYTPAPAAGDTGGPVGRIDPAFRPAPDATARIDAPQQYTPEPVEAQVRLDLPVPVQTDAKPAPLAVAPPAPATDPAPRPTAEPPPVDVPGFAVVRDRVASGKQPFPDGIAWLQSKGYRTVLHLRAPGEDGTAARRQFEKRGLQYVSLEVAPGVLTNDLIEQFNRIVTDETNLPLFICDRDGALTGTLWYLHFRLKGMPEEKALAEAKRLGFRPEQDVDHKALFNAARALVPMAQQ